MVTEVNILRDIFRFVRSAIWPTLPLSRLSFVFLSLHAVILLSFLSSFHPLCLPTFLLSFCACVLSCNCSSFFFSLPAMGCCVRRNYYPLCWEPRAIKGSLFYVWKRSKGGDWVVKKSSPKFSYARKTHHLHHHHHLSPNEFRSLQKIKNKIIKATRNSSHHKQVWFAVHNWRHMPCLKRS